MVILVQERGAIFTHANGPKSQRGDSHIGGGRFWSGPGQINSRFSETSVGVHHGFEGVRKKCVGPIYCMCTPVSGGS